MGEDCQSQSVAGASAERLPFPPTSTRRWRWPASRRKPTKYRLGNRSALEWVIDQYQVSEDKRSGITFNRRYWSNFTWPPARSTT